MISWSLQHGFIPLPKSVTEERVEANAEISLFEIDDTDMDHPGMSHDIAISAHDVFSMYHFHFSREPKDW